MVKSEEAFFGKVRKDKLDAASIRSSNRDSIWGTPTPSLYSRPDCKVYLIEAAIRRLTVFLSAPTHAQYPTVDYNGPLRNDAGEPDTVPMTRLQISMAREVGGWPLYTIVIGIGQVRIFSCPHGC